LQRVSGKMGPCFPPSRCVLRRVWSSVRHSCAAATADRKGDRIAGSHKNGARWLGVHRAPISWPRSTGVSAAARRRCCGTDAIAATLGRFRPWRISLNLHGSSLPPCTGHMRNERNARRFKPLAKSAAGGISRALPILSESAGALDSLFGRVSYGEPEGHFAGKCSNPERDQGPPLAFRTRTISCRGRRRSWHRTASPSLPCSGHRAHATAEARRARRQKQR